MKFKKGDRVNVKEPSLKKRYQITWFSHMKGNHLIRRIDSEDNTIQLDNGFWVEADWCTLMSKVEG